MKTFTAVAAVLMFTTVATAQTPCTPYSWDDAVCVSAPVVAPPLTTPDHEPTRYAFVQASVGKPGRELAYLLLLNLDPSGNGQSVQVDYILEDGRRLTRFYQLRSFFALRSERLALGLHEMPELGQEAFVSVLVTFNAPGAAEMVWHRASDLAEVATKQGQHVSGGGR